MVDFVVGFFLVKGYNSAILFHMVCIVAHGDGVKNRALWDESSLVRVD